MVNNLSLFVLHVALQGSEEEDDEPRHRIRVLLPTDLDKKKSSSEKNIVSLFNKPKNLVLNQPRTKNQPKKE